MNQVVLRRDVHFICGKNWERGCWEGAGKIGEEVMAQRLLERPLNDINHKQGPTFSKGIRGRFLQGGLYEQSQRAGLPD